MLQVLLALMAALKYIVQLFAPVHITTPITTPRVITSSLDEFCSLNYEWVKAKLASIRQHGYVKSVHVAFVVGDRVVVGYDKGKRNFDFPGGNTDARIKDPVKQFLEAMFREPNEEFGIVWNAPLEWFVRDIILCGDKHKNLLVVCSVKDVPIKAIRNLLDFKQTQSLTEDYLEMTDVLLTTPQLIHNPSSYVASRYHQVVAIAKGATYQHSFSDIAMIAY
jgi:hypothetical protein